MARSSPTTRTVALTTNSVKSEYRLKELSVGGGAEDGRGAEHGVRPHLLASAPNDWEPIKWGLPPFNDSPIIIIRMTTPCLRVLAHVPFVFAGGMPSVGDGFSAFDRHGVGEGFLDAAMDALELGYVDRSNGVEVFSEDSIAEIDEP